MLFEHETQISEFIFEKQLSNLVRNVWEMELVFLAACNSEFAAQIFLKKGAKHVICIESTKEVLDDAVLTFANNFYRYLFSGKDICDAFHTAQKFTGNMHKEREALIFKLLSEKKHDCKPIEFNHDHEQFKDSSDKILVKEIPGKIDNMSFREKEIGKLVQKIMQGSRLVCVLGLNGIGKSWIARNSLHYIKERKYFCGGLLFVPLTGMRSVEAVCHQLYGLLVKNIVVSADNREYLECLLDSKADSISFFVDFFNNKTNFVLKRTLHYPGRNFHKTQASKKYLLCFDNAEDLIDTRKDEFRSMIKKLLSSCPYLQIIITSRQHIPKIEDSIETDLMFIPPLKGDKPVQLFLQKSAKNRQVTIEEVVEIIKMEKDYDVAGLMNGQYSDLSSTQAEAKLLLLLRQNDKLVEALQRHELFRNLAGNPLCITNVVAQYASPVMKEQRKNLKTLYELYLQEKLNVEEDDRVSRAGNSNDKNSN